MADHLTKVQRSNLMKAVKPTGSYIERELQKALWHRGYRYRKNYRRAAGTPDIAFVSLKIAVFCDSEFWHGHDWQNRKHDFKSNKRFWHEKIERNIERDKQINHRLRRDGWTVLRFWGKEIERNLSKCIRRIEKAIERKRKKLQQSHGE